MIVAGTTLRPDQVRVLAGMVDGELAAKLEREQRALAQRAAMQDQRAVRLLDVAARALGVAAGSLVQRIALRDGAVLGRASLRAPAAAGIAEFEGRIERTAIDAGLTARENRHWPDHRASPAV